MDDLAHIQVASRKGGCHVNKKLLPIKGFYFAFLAAVGSLLPFLTIYMQSLGLTSSEAGVLYGVMPFVGFFIRPVVGAIADRWSKHKQVLMVCSFFTGLFYALILTVPARARPSLVVHSQLDCNIHDSFFRDCISKPSVGLVNSHTCTVSLTEFADIVAASRNSSTSSNDTNYDCEAQCSQTQNQNADNVQICFANGPSDFEKYCSGTVVGESTVTFHLQNMTHILDSEIVGDRIDQENVHCRDYDLKMVAFGGKQHWQFLCDVEATLTCAISCKQPPPQLCQPHVKEYDAVYFWLFFIYLLANLFFSPVFSLADAATFDLLGEHPEKFGRQRLWGTVGFALLAITSTFAVYIMTQQGNQTNYTVCFYIFAVLCCCATVIAYFLDLSANIRCGRNMFHNFLALLSDMQVLAFLMVVLYFGMATGVIEAFLFWYLKDLGAEPLVFGFSLVINCLFEVPMLFLSGLFIKRVGAVPCLYLAIIALTLRMLAYSLLVNPWMVLVIEPLHGITFGIMWAAASTHAALIAPPGMSATIQGLVGGIHFGIGKGIGSLVTGFMFDKLGERTTFRVYAGVSAGLFLLYFLLNQFVFKSQMHPSHPQHDNSREGVSGSGDDLRENNGYPLLTPPSDTTDQADREQRGDQ